MTFGWVCTKILLNTQYFSRVVFLVTLLSTSIASISCSLKYSSNSNQHSKQIIVDHRKTKWKLKSENFQLRSLMIKQEYLFIYNIVAFMFHKSRIVWIACFVFPLLSVYLWTFLSIVAMSFKDLNNLLSFCSQYVQDCFAIHTFGFKRSNIQESNENSLDSQSRNRHSQIAFVDVFISTIMQTEAQSNIKQCLFYKMNRI
jgi:hypothetical protein